MNILFTSAGRRGYLVRYFKEALAGRGKVFAGNSIDGVPSFYEADETVVTPMIYDKEYIPFLLKYCEKKHIQAILSLYDVDLPVLAHYRSEFEKIGTKLIVADEEFVQICNDKWKTYQFLKHNGFNTPKTFLNVSEAKKEIEKGELLFPLVVKPRFGNGSISIMFAYDMQELEVYYGIVEKSVERSWLKYESANQENKVVIQEMIQGNEYGLDILNHIHTGQFASAVVKRKIAMRSGETDRAVVVDDSVILEVAKRLGKCTGHIGNLDCDGFWYNNQFYILEMNARFGGGYPFSHVAGANYPLAIVNWLLGETVDESLFQAKAGVEAYKNIQLLVV